MINMLTTGGKEDGGGEGEGEGARNHPSSHPHTAIFGLHMYLQTDTYKSHPHTCGNVSITIYVIIQIQILATQWAQTRATF